MEQSSTTKNSIFQIQTDPSVETPHGWSPHVLLLPIDYFFCITAELEGRLFQPIMLIRSNGGISRIPQLAQSVLFAVGFD